MNARTNDIEPRLYSGYWDDGFLDLFFGIAITAIGISWAYELIPLGACAPAILIPIWHKLRRTVVEPRAGYVEFSDARMQWTQQWVWMALGVGVLFFVLGIGTYLVVRQSPPTGGTFLKLLPGIPAFLIALLAAIGGLTLGLPRSLFYAVMLALCGLAVSVLKAEPHHGLLVAGMVITLCGAILVTRFLQIDVDPGE